MSRKEAIDLPPAEGRARVVAVMNQKGGVGKTTLVLALAYAARAAGHNVVVLDTDPQASATLWARRRERLSGVKDASFDVRSTSGKPEIIEHEIERATSERAGWVFIDTAPSASGTSVELVALADVVLVPVGDGAFDVSATGPTIELIKAGGRTPIIVFNRVQANANRAINDLADTFLRVKEGIAIGPTLRSRAEVKHAQTALRTVAEFKPSSRAAAEVLALWKYVMRCFVATNAAAPAKEVAHV